MTNINLDQIYVPSDSIVSRYIENELIIVPIDSDTIDLEHSLYSLNKIGIQIWKRLDPSTTIDQICLDLAEKFEAPLETIQNDVLELIDDLLEKNLIKQINT